MTKFLCDTDMYLLLAYECVTIMFIMWKPYANNKIKVNKKLTDS